MCGGMRIHGAFWDIRESGIVRTGYKEVCGWGLITESHTCHVKEFGFYSEDNGKSVRDFKQGNDTIRFAF